MKRLTQLKLKRKMETGDANSIKAREKVGKESGKWILGLSTKTRTYRATGRPKKRWEEEINEFLKPDETETTKGNEMKNNDT